MTSKIGIYYGYFVHDRTADYGPLIRKAAALGFTGLEISVVPLLDQPDSFLDELRRIQVETGIDLYFASAVPVGSDISSEDREEREKGIAFVTRSLHVANRLGGQAINGVLYGSWMATPKQIETGREPYLLRCADSLRRIAESADQLGLTLNLEIINRFEQFLLNTVEQGLEFLEFTGCANLRLHLDTFHMNIEEDDPAAAILAAGNKIGFFHVSENNRRLPGTGGHIDWPGIAGALKKTGYAGPVVIESVVTPRCNFSKFFKIWRNLAAGDLDSAARKSGDFLKGVFSEDSLRP